MAKHSEQATAGHAPVPGRAIRAGQSGQGNQGRAIRAGQLGQTGQLGQGVASLLTWCLASSSWKFGWYTSSSCSVLNTGNRKSNRA